MNIVSILNSHMMPCVSPGSPGLCTFKACLMSWKVRQHSQCCIPSPPRGKYWCTCYTVWEFVCFFYLVNFKQGWDVWLWRNKPPNRRPKQTPKQASETHPSRPHPGLGTPFWEYYLTSCACKHTPTHTCTYFVPTNPRWRYFRMGTGAAFGSFPGCAVWWLLWWRCCRRFGVLAEVVMSFFLLILIQILSALICWIDLCGRWFHQAGALFRQMKWRERVPKSWSCSCESQFLLNDWMVRWCCFGYLVS